MRNIKTHALVMNENDRDFIAEFCKGKLGDDLLRRLRTPRGSRIGEVTIKVSLSDLPVIGDALQSKAADDDATLPVRDWAGALAKKLSALLGAGR